jgi:hypothetical protein
MKSGFCCLADIQHEKTLYEELLSTSDWNSYRRFVAYFDSMPDVLTSGSFAPEFDFHGRPLQSLSDDPPLKIVAFNILPRQAGGIAVLGWTKESDVVATQLIQSLLTLRKQQISDALVRLAFTHLENIYSRPSWWESLPRAGTDRLHQRALIGAHPELMRENDCLCDDGLFLADWDLKKNELMVSGACDSS